MNDKVDQIYEEIEGASRPIWVNLRKLEQKFIKEQKEIEETHLAHFQAIHISVMIKNSLQIFTMRKKHFLQNKKKH